MEVLVYLQIENNEISENSIDLISYAKEISNGALISAAVVLPVDLNLDFSNLSKFGLNKLYVLRSNLSYYDKTRHPYLILNLIKEINPEIFILNSTTEGREIAPIVASSLGTGLTADCTKLEIEGDKLISTRPTFGGKLMASILSKKNPQMATIRVNTFKKKEFENAIELEIKDFNFEIESRNIEILNYENKKESFFNIQNARIVLCGGMGLRNKENFDKLKHLAKLMNACAAGTRKAVDKGLIEKEVQIGQTGVSVTPEIYIGFGVSGAIHHITGMENSKKIIAINIDKSAPIFNYSDAGIVDDAIKVLDALIKFYEN